MTNKRLDEIIDKAVDASIKKVLNEGCLSLNMYKESEPMTFNQMMSLNEMGQVNKREQKNDKKSSFDANTYYVYVRGEGSANKFPHFHIKHIGEGWDIRMNISDGSFHSIKDKSRSRQNPCDFTDIEKISMKWVKQPNTSNPSLTNGELAAILWDSQN